MVARQGCELYRAESGDDRRDILRAHIMALRQTFGPPTLFILVPERSLGYEGDTMRDNVMDMSNYVRTVYDLSGRVGLSVGNGTQKRDYVRDGVKALRLRCVWLWEEFVSVNPCEPADGEQVKRTWMRMREQFGMFECIHPLHAGRGRERYTGTENGGHDDLPDMFNMGVRCTVLFPKHRMQCDYAALGLAGWRLENLYGSFSALLQDPDWGGAVNYGSYN